MVLYIPAYRWNKFCDSDNLVTVDFYQIKTENFMMMSRMTEFVKVFPPVTFPDCSTIL